MISSCRVHDCERDVHHRRNQLCKMHQTRFERNGHTNRVRTKPELKQCQEPGCTNLTRSGAAVLCKKHYHREYRHLDVAANAYRIHTSNGRRYRAQYRPDHDLAGKRGMVYEHRVVLYDRIGPGLHSCHWCNTEVTWDADRFDPNVLQVDHLNGYGDDNRPDNLVPSCRRCNTRRGAQERHDQLVTQGYWAGNDTVANTKRGRTERIA